MIAEITHRFDSFIMTYGGAPDTLFLSHENVGRLQLTLGADTGQVTEGAVYMGMTIVISDYLEVAVGLVI